MTPAELKELYQSKFISLEEALDSVHSGDVIATGSYGNEPVTLLRSLHKVAARGVDDLTVWMGIPAEEYPFVADDSLTGINILSIFYGPALRKHQASGRISFVPNHLHAVSNVIQNCKKPNVFFAAVTPMDEYGCVCMSMSQQMELEMLDLCDTVILEVNDKLPRTLGTIRVPVEKVTHFITSDAEISHAPQEQPDAVTEQIAENVAALINDGDTLQLGIGTLPDAVADRLTDRHDLGIYTEMIGTSMGKLMWCGAVNNSRKRFYQGRTIGAFAWGSQELYNFLDGNPMVELFPANYVNNPYNIMKNENMVSVNTALQIDLTGQVCSEYIGGQQYSGTGGATDFAYGAYHAKGGKGIIAMRSTAKGGTISRIVPYLDRGAVVSIQRNIVDYIVTEYGVAHIRDGSIRQRVEGLISIAHPDFRDQLRREAKENMIW
jgi:acyl-CoA hydrolase